MNELAPAIQPDDDTPPPRTGFRLARLEVFNWGTFDAKVWALDLGGENTLLTGDIGSGKSTLVDAVTTLLIPSHRINYNKAAGADQRERDLRSYVLGYYKSEKGESGASAKPVALRDHNTYSVILGHFRNDELGQDVTLAQVFWIKDHVNQPDRFFVVAGRRLSIAGDFGGITGEIGVLKKRLRAQDDIILTESYPPYCAEFSRRFGIGSDQALELFHQTVSMKSVGNLTDFVRSHMLEAFEVDKRINALVLHFDDLTRAHDAVVRAKRQISLLTPLVADCDRHAAHVAEVTGLRECRDLALRPWFAGYKADLLGSRLAGLDQAFRRQEAKVADLSSAQAGHVKRRGELEQAIRDHGGDRLQTLRNDIATQEKERDSRRNRADAYDRVVQDLGFPAVIDQETFLANKDRLTREREDAQARQAEAQNALVEAEVGLRDLKRKHDAVDAELKSLRQRPSNIPKQMLDLRNALCHATGIAAEDLPFAGEHLRVRPEDRVWEGAAERLLHSFALSLLVPDAHYAKVAEWVDRTHLGGRLVYYRVRDRGYSVSASPGPTSLARKLEIKADSSFYAWLDGEIGRRFDYACCDTLDQFRLERQAITRQGQVKGNHDRHEKDDRRAIDDRTSYVLGWSNTDKIAALEAQARGLERQIQAAADNHRILHENARKPGEQLQRLSKLEAWAEFRDIDWRGPASLIQRLELEKREIEASSDVLRTLEGQLAGVNDAVAQVEGELEAAKREKNFAEEKIRAAREVLEAAVKERDGVPADVAERCFPELEAMRAEALGDRKLTVESCDNAAQDMREWLQKKKIDVIDLRVTATRDRIISAMTAYRKEYPQETLEVDSTLEYAPDYCRMLDDLVRDGLPRFEADFKKQLNENAIREIANFQSQLNREVGEIEERIERINLSLVTINYNPGRYILLEAERTQDADIRAFQQDLRACTESALTGSDEDGYSEAKFLQVKAIVERFRGRADTAEADKRWRNRVTDVRNWFVFAASERWRETDEPYEHYSDSAGKSGGQKEKLAYTVLAASLAYQFGLDWGSGRARTFRFVVIDEAFGRGSDESTRYGLQLFGSMGLQLLIVTPLQKIPVIEPFVAAVGFVDNPKGDRSRLTNLSIEEYRAGREARRGA
ncbi:ATP-binding protein [Magnetospirillum sp. UT-4]|uniref:ATP-binding protein n=1 Tax=Magnetospirillum sp. UT-4 TaxID=2681467 RepID=UPI00137FD64D|nr:ATP-binding protein [Magnetospirillum sp. UT-4]CAA7612926.1 conserved hypothetical protein [Magnetospirillum sp. UT-4]